jgi:hypothetical protein
MITELCKIGLLSEVTGGRRNRMFRSDPYLDLFADVAEPPSDGLVAAQPTQY